MDHWCSILHLSARQKSFFNFGKATNLEEGKIQNTKPQESCLENLWHTGAPTHLCRQFIYIYIYIYIKKFLNIISIYAKFVLFQTKFFIYIYVFSLKVNKFYIYRYGVFKNWYHYIYIYIYIYVCVCVACLKKFDIFINK